LIYVPDWLPVYWRMNITDSLVTITPRDPATSRDFSDIRMDIATTTESFNAETLYSEAGKGEGITLSEVLLNHDQYDSKEICPCVVVILR
jgi:hypothetical protein